MCKKGFYHADYTNGDLMKQFHTGTYDFSHYASFKASPPQKKQLTPLYIIISINILLQQRNERQ